MTSPRAFITGLGIVSSAGSGLAEVLSVLKAGQGRLRPLDLFPTTLAKPPVVGQVADKNILDNLPRTQALALAASQQALADDPAPPDALVLGVATGSVLRLEEALQNQTKNPANYRKGTGPVAEFLSNRLGCLGPAFSISTACSSGAVALKVGLELIRSKRAQRVLVCGAESLSRLTVYGFHFLQLLDPEGTRPLDRRRAGMSLGEGAAAFLLTAGNNPPNGALAELRGGGLSCDAHHPIAPHPEGLGAAAAMEISLKDAGAAPGDIDYLNLHGTGTIDNDESEAVAVRSVFHDRLPPMSSTKGVFGHTTAAAGTIEAAVAVLAIRHGFVPPNVGLTQIDPDLGLDPVREIQNKKIDLVLSNSFGFGGNNASLVLGRADLEHNPAPSGGFFDLEVLGGDCITGAGHAEASLKNLTEGLSCAGMLPQVEVGVELPPRALRRMKRLPRLTMALAHGALTDAEKEKGPDKPKPSSVYFGTGWGTLSETYTFLKQLFDTNEKYSSPVDFMGSVHNAPAGHVGLFLKCTGANVTTWGGWYAFEQALFLAGLAPSSDGGDVVLIGADEAHPDLTPHVDPDAYARSGLADGGGGLILRPTRKNSGLRLRPTFFERGRDNPAAVPGLVKALNQTGPINQRHKAVLAGLPIAIIDRAKRQLDEFMALSGFQGPVIDSRQWLGDFATSTAAAAVLAVKMVRQGSVPTKLAGRETPLDGQGLLLLSFGDYITAIEILV